MPVNVFKWNRFRKCEICKNPLYGQRSRSFLKLLPERRRPRLHALPTRRLISNEQAGTPAAPSMTIIFAHPPATVQGISLLVNSSCRERSSAAKLPHTTFLKLASNWGQG